MKRKSVSEPSWERIDHVYTSTLYLSLSLPFSAAESSSFSVPLSLPLSVILSFSCLSLLSSLPLLCLSYSHFCCFPLSLSISIQSGNGIQQHRHEMRARTVNFLLNECDAVVTTTCHTWKKYLAD